MVAFAFIQSRLYNKVATSVKYFLVSKRLIQVANRQKIQNLELKMGGSHSSRSYSPNTGGSGSSKCPGPAKPKSKNAAPEEYVEAVVCNNNDLQDNEMKVFDIGEDGKVLLIKQHGELSAIGHKCSHYGAPLVSGALGEGRVRCPWHGACFNTKTGDIEDFPGFDSLPCYQVTVGKKGEVKVRARKSDLKSNKRVVEVAPGGICEQETVVIIGGGPSGATCAETLRTQGFAGRVVIVAKENYLPYDRIKVSKIGNVPDISTLQARNKEYYQNARIEVMLGVEATKIDPVTKFVHLSNGEKLNYSYVYAATGSKPRIPAIAGIANVNNIFTVRNYEDSVNILNTLGTEKAMNVVVLGLSFIGLETASTCKEKARSVTVVGTDSAPLAQVFGQEIGQSLQKLFEDKGIRFHFNTTITKIHSCHGKGDLLKSVELKDGTVLPADILILGVGTTFNTEVLRCGGIAFEENGSVTVNEKLETTCANIYAGGDIACAPVFAHGSKNMAIGHVGLAQYHGRIAALNIMKKDVPLRTVPYFWTQLFGKSIRYAGCGKHTSTIIDGDVPGLKFVIFFLDHMDKVIAMASCMRDPIVSQFAELLHSGKHIYRGDLHDDLYRWTKQPPV